MSDPLNDCHSTKAADVLLDAYAIETSTCCGLTFEAHDETVTDHVVRSQRLWDAQLHDLVDTIEQQVRATRVTSEPSLPVPDALTERQAWFVYEGARIAAAAALAPIIPEPWAQREEAFRSQFLNVIAKQVGPDRSGDPEALHGEWVTAYAAMGWTYGPERDPVRKTHPDMVPYADLGQLERDKDAVFVALCEIARQWVYAARLSGTPE